MVLYARVSTDEQATVGYGLDVQRAELERAADYHRWRVVELVRDEGYSGKDLDRPGLRRSLELIARGRADGLAVSKLDRLSRSVIDGGLLAEWFEELDARLVALDLNIDTHTPGGRLVFHIMGAMGQWERETIAQRTRDGLAEVRRQGRPTGPPAVADIPELSARIAFERAAGATLQEIADKLNADGIPTMRGGMCWRPSSVQIAAGYHRRRPKRKVAQLPRRLTVKPVR
jgi:DNA invertase Pin-like site-specific DNA recombinase